jgi:hypothetical protein
MTLPRKLPQVWEQRERTVQQRNAGGLASGRLKAAALVPAKPPTPQGIPAFITVDHFDDGDMARPIAAHVYWRGAATPSNAEPTDTWYPSNDL